MLLGVKILKLKAIYKRHISFVGGVANAR